MSIQRYASNYSEDPFDLQRFIKAQENVYDSVVRELRNGRKTSHWIWFIFPQFEGLGYSHNSKFYAIHSLEEAKAYIAHPVLRAHYFECMQALLETPSNSALEVLGEPDDTKVQSSLSLFLQILPTDPTLLAVLEKFYQGKLCRKTLALIKNA